MLVSTQDRSTVCAERTIGSEISLLHLMVLLGDVGEVEARFEILLISTQDSCTICANRAIVSEVMLAHPMELQGYTGQVEARISPFGDSVELDAR